MQRLSRTARHAALLIGLLTVFFVLLSWQVNRTRTLDAARGAVTGVVSPFQRVFGGAVSAVTGAWGGYFDLLRADEEAERLQAEVDRLERSLASLEETRRENFRLRALLGLGKQVEQDHRVATVVGRSLAHRYQSVTLDRGSADGIRIDAPVLAPDGALVGRVVQVSRWTSVVQLITDPFSGVGARLTHSRATGLVAGSDGPLLELRYIDTMTPVDTGESVITSGEDGIYPPGLPIGTVTEFEVGPPVPGTPRVPLAREETALFLEITVTPAADVTRVETVLVLDPATGP